ncbi:response regulator transcription factor [Polaribacter pectinis]|uniref:Response regulator transcription factor n=1 Tax=Polaribacter pectinis TaxID=2738844 RepID=A0A7G9L7F8_9FLAO|nr:response regulator transcription factor [Polaribacter pectinis]QNM84557.1 response regulator transcription factor [Polaribacter pectinis]
MKKVVIVEDNKTLNDAFCDIINSSKSFKVVGQYLDAESSIENLQKDKSDFILMDVQLPGINGVEATKIIKKEKPKINIIIITVYENSETVFEALCAGATGYLTKNTTQSRLLDAMEEALNGGAPMSIHIAKMVVSSFKKTIHADLSERELEVLTLLSKGKSYRSIAEVLFISPNTIKFHIKNIYDKLQVKTKEDAILKANNQNLI